MNTAIKFAIVCLSICCAATLRAQTIYKCPDANGRVALQDLPCAGGEKREISPASGSDKKASTSAATPSKTGAPSELDLLRNSVGKDAAARKFKDADYEIGVYNTRINNFPVYRAKTLEEKAIYNLCGSGKFTYRCEDMDNRRRVDAELSVELNYLYDMRTNAKAVKTAANKAHYEITQKWLAE